MPRGNPQNLRPQNTRTKEEQKKVAIKGGIASGIARREKKKLSDIYREFLSTPEGQKYIDKAIKKGFDKNPTSMLHEMRDATEGTKTTIANDPDNPMAISININGAKPN